ncbi:MAG TPA: transglutaminase-like domain-containing protein, partial [Terriglobales bacterium]|nr:transglutaminase-like domain-containing protein [Terriglobales bacterium]
SFTVRVSDLGKPLDVWFPMAHSDLYQQVKVVSVTSDLPLEQRSEQEYGNRIFYAHAAHARKPEYHFTVKYDVVRLEHLASATAADSPSKTELQRFLHPDRLVPVTGKPAELARAQVKPGMSEIEKARALYDYTFSTMRYDKSGSGWGRGDAVWACDAKHGNCTDFHSVFISMARSQRIPAKFEIGFPLPERSHGSDVAGYHCWAEFYVPQRGWFPVDISEAWLHQEKKEYFFGANDVNRVQFTVGRDITLSPRQHGPALNYFIYPYVELGGEAYPNVANAFSFSDVAGVETATRR